MDAKNTNIDDKDLKHNIMTANIALSIWLYQHSSNTITTKTNIYLSHIGITSDGPKVLLIQILSNPRTLEHYINQINYML